MATVGNFIWFIFGGWAMALGWLIAAALAACTIIGLPVAVACMRMASFSAFPFGKELVPASLLAEKRVPGTAVFNIVWFFFPGLFLAAGHVLSALALLASSIFVLPILLGSPAWMLAHLRLAGVALNPLGKRIVSKAEAAAYRAEWARRNVQAKMAATR